MSKAVKQLLMDDLVERVGEVRELLVIDSSRLDAVTANRFRLDLREKAITALTVRNSLAKRAFQRLGFDALDPFLEGPTTLVWGGEDIVALSKEIARWAREVEPLQIKGGALEGAPLTAAEVEAVSKWPTREELLSIVAGQVLGVAGEIAGQLVGPASQLASQVEKLIEQQGPDQRNAENG